MTIGFIGLGNLGTVMVKNLIDRGRTLHIYNRTTAKLKEFENKATLYSDIPTFAKACNIVVSIVSDDKAVEDISLGKEGLVEHLSPDSVHVCLSTIAPATSTTLHKAHMQKGIDYVTATIIGRPEAALARNLTVCMSGTTPKIEEVTELLKDLGGKNFYNYGDDPKNAAVVKVCNNFLIIAAIEAMGEAFNLVEKAGADKASFYQMISDTLFNAPIYKNYGKIMIDETYDKAGFTSQLGLKDTKLALSLAEETTTALPLADIIKNRFLINHSRGRNQWDWTSIVKVIEEESNNIKA